MRAQRRGRIDGFSLVELAIVLVIVGILMLSLMYTLSAQVDQRNFEDTRRRLDQARELLLAFAIVNGRLPCPATATSTGNESPSGGDVCTTYYGGWLPARTIGFQQADSNGYALDAWGNRIRYAVSNTSWSTGPARFTKRHDPTITSPATVAASGWQISTAPADLVICGSITGTSGTTCNTAPSVTNQNVVVAIVFATGKNGGATCATCTDEAANTNGDALFVFHTPTPASFATGEFDDQFTWIAVGDLYARMIAAGVLP